MACFGHVNAKLLPCVPASGAGPDSYGLAGGYASDTATGHHMPHASQHHMTSHTITSGSSRDYSGLLPHDALHPPGAVRSMSQQMYPAMATVDGGFGVEQGGITVSDNDTVPRSSTNVPL